MAKSVFFSFHYDRDHWRVQQIIQMGALEGETTLNAQQWEEVKRQGDAAIKKWITDQMAYKSAVVVLVGAKTASRPWVKHEIISAWNNRKPLVGIRIHGLAGPGGETDTAGASPFAGVKLPTGKTVGDYVPLHTPSSSGSQGVYDDIKKNLTTWVDGAYKRT